MQSTYITENINYETKQKRCTNCLIWKSETVFYNSRNGIFGKTSQCKVCTNSRNIKNYLTRKAGQPIKPATAFSKYVGSPDKLNYNCKDCKQDHRKTYLKRSYNLSVEEYIDLCEKQNNACYICNCIPKTLAVDHCHKTGKIRHLLCRECNAGLGMFKDNIANLKAAVNYLESTTYGL